jgi:hypothetical protein
VQPSFPPDAAPVVVDRVEWVPASPESVHVHVYGRWRDRPVSEPMVLLVGTERRRHAFDALERPPEGVLVAFAVPNELRARLGEDIAIQIGPNELPLPGAGTGSVREADEPEPEAEVIDRAVLAERRARRAELAEDTLMRRAEDAERTKETLEAQLANLEQRLEGARVERDELDAKVAEAERKLRAAEQREYAEQQRRIDLEDEVERVRRDAEHEVGELRRRLEAANQRAEDLAREVDRARRGIAEALQRSEADRAALRRAEEQMTARNERVLAAEAADERRSHLEHALEEVENRARELQAGLASERVARERADQALADSREEAQAKVTLLEHELAQRETIQTRIAEQLHAVREELDHVRAQARAQADSQTGVTQSVASLQEIADRLKDRIVDLERRKDAAEAELAHTRAILDQRSTELERARIDLKSAQREAELMRAEATKHQAALEQANRTMEAVRTSAGELQARIDGERRERAQSEALLHEQLAHAQAEGQRTVNEIEVELRMALETERRAFAEQVQRIESHVAGLREQVVSAAAGLRDSLDAERAAREAAERLLAEERDRVSTERQAAAEALAQLALEQNRRSALETQVSEALSAVRDVRAEDEARSARDAAVQQLVAEVLGTAASLRDAYERESRKLEGELTQRVVDERKQMATELAAMEARATDLQSELHGAGEELEAELQAERTARWLAEAELARLRQGAPAAAPSRPAPAPRAAEPAPAPPEPVAAEPVAGEPVGPEPDKPAIIDDLESAAERLRETVPPPEREPEREPAAPSDRTPLRPRLVSAAERRPTGWLAESIRTLSAHNPDVAARLVVALLPVQRLFVDGDLTYDLTVTELGTYRVALHGGATSVDPRAEPGGRKEVDFHLEGTAAALADLIAGGIRKRAKDTHFDGSRRKLKRLVKAMRDPVQIADVARSGAGADPGLVLAALATAVDPAWTQGHMFTVAFEVDGGTWTVGVDQGPLSVQAGLPDDGPSATVHMPPAVFLPILGGVAPPPGLEATASGNARAVELLRQWFDTAQGLT